MPSFGYGGPGAPQSFSVLVSLSQKSGSGGLPSGPAPARSTREPTPSQSIAMIWSVPGRRMMEGRVVPKSQLQRLRYQMVGRTSRLAASGPTFRTSICHKRSSGPSLAHVTVTTK